MSLPSTPLPLDACREVQDQFGRIPMVLYLAGPLRGDGTPGAIRHNQKRMEAMARQLQALLPWAVLVVPHGNFSFVDESGSQGLGARARVLLACERLLLRCDGLILCGQTLSPGMVREQAVARKAGLPMIQIPGWDGPGEGERDDVKI
jgi:hypothetical protein